MAASPDDVRIINQTKRSDEDITFFLGSAACIMDLHESCLSNVSDECKDKGQAYLAAHLMASSPSDQAVSSYEFEGSAKTFQTVLGSGINSTQYGQMANSLLGGCLSNIGKQKAMVVWL